MFRPAPAGRILYPGANFPYDWMVMIRSLRRRFAGTACLLSLSLFALEGCAHVTRIGPADYAGLDGRGKAVISTRDGKVYEFNRVSIDSSNFLGRVDIVRNVVGPGGHLDAIEDVLDVRVPFSEVESVELRRVDILGTGVLVVAVAAGLALLVRSFQPPPDTGGGGGGGGGDPTYRPHPVPRAP